MSEPEPLPSTGDAFELDNPSWEDVNAPTHATKRRFQEAFRSLPWQLVPVEQRHSDMFDDRSMGIYGTLTAKLSSPFVGSNQLPPGTSPAAIELEIKTDKKKQIISSYGPQIDGSSRGALDSFLTLIENERLDDERLEWFMRGCSVLRDLVSLDVPDPQEPIRTLLGTAPSIHESQEMRFNFNNGSTIDASRRLQTPQLYLNPVLGIGFDMREVRHLSVKNGLRRGVYDNPLHEEIVFRDNTELENMHTTDMDAWYSRIREQQLYERLHGLTDVFEGKLRLLSQLIERAVESGLAS